ncbi:4Fe-4S dicluster domain-containing protein [Spirosoma taeanense]|uniref:4Fe-4S dicluster domain-containing protein n=1 Tax=Spirosoma taeanense TaxID=2735870 RepID=A0A6M5Y0N3_9BACT|nr:4Fe-4S dicluster domain-containing protein [Spirosoma taeanense]QJW88328.1 4Fe-4S dicluster domain-containing protein [Spirosoma taeanense]
MSYFQDIQAGIRTTLKGLSLTFRHLKNATHRRTPEGIADANYFDQQNGLVTLQYPHEQLPIPDNGRYRLRNEIEDCIVCDKCAKVCPVDCITIDAIKATEEVGRASDGSPIRLYAAKFDIDMAKCCYCGLCTAVCPTECLTMDKKFDYSEFELGKLTYQFAELTPAEAEEKRALYEQFVREKEEQKKAQAAAKAAAQPAPAPEQAAPAAKRPIFRPTAKPTAPPETVNSAGSSAEHPLTDATPDEMQQIAQGGLETQKRPVFRPTRKPETPLTDTPLEDKTEKITTMPADEPTLPDTKAVTPKPAFRPTMKPGAGSSKPAEAQAKTPANEPAPAELPKPEPAFRPTMKPGGDQSSKPAQQESEPTAKPQPAAEAPKPKPAFRPTMKPAVAPSKPSAEPALSGADDSAEVSEKPVAEAPKLTEARPKPAFRPTMKPKPDATPPKPDESA